MNKNSKLAMVPTMIALLLTLTVVAQEFMIESGYSEQVNNDPYRYSLELEKELINWFMKSSEEMISDQKISANLQLAELTAEEVEKYSTTLSFDDWKIKLGEKPQFGSNRYNATFFSPADLKRLGGAKVMADFRHVVKNVAVRAQHRNVDKNEVPEKFIGMSAEDDPEYTWPKRSFGKSDGVYLNLTTKAIQFTKLVKDLEEDMKKLVEKGELDENVAYRLSNGAKRFLLGFGIHETFHAYQYSTVPVRNVNNEKMKGSIKDGLFVKFGNDFSEAGSKSKIGNVDRYIEKSTEHAKKQVSALRLLVDSKPYSSMRRKAVSQLKKVMKISYDDHIKQRLVGGTSEDVWNYIAKYEIQNKKSLYWDSVIHAMVYEIEGFGLNRVLLKGHERELMEFAYLVQQLRTDDIVADGDLFDVDIEALEKRPYESIVSSLKGKYRPRFAAPDFSKDPVQEALAKPYSLLRWDPVEADKPVGPHIGNDPVSYYMLWDGYMAWMGFAFEPPVDDFMKGFWVPVLLNHRMVELAELKIPSASNTKEVEELKVKACHFLDTNWNKLVNTYTNVNYQEIKDKFSELYSKFYKNKGEDKSYVCPRAQ